MRKMTEQTSSSEENLKEQAVPKINEDSDTKVELEKEREKANDYLNRLKYLQADFENYKKRANKEVNEAVQYGNRRLILELLTVLDELECAVENGKKNNGKETYFEGVEMTFKKFYSILKKEGLLEIEAVGKPFDPNKHEAVSRVETNGKDGVVLEEIRKGFMLKDVVIRPSLVTVAVDTAKKVKKE